VVSGPFIMYCRNQPWNGKGFCGPFLMRIVYETHREISRYLDGQRLLWKDGFKPGLLILDLAWKLAACRELGEVTIRESCYWLTTVV
jgi:hypothetical protein